MNTFQRILAAAVLLLAVMFVPCVAQADDGYYWIEQEYIGATSDGAILFVDISNATEAESGTDMPHSSLLTDATSYCVEISYFEIEPDLSADAEWVVRLAVVGDIDAASADVHYALNSRIWNATTGSYLTPGQRITYDLRDEPITLDLSFWDTPGTGGGTDILALTDGADAQPKRFRCGSSANNTLFQSDVLLYTPTAPAAPTYGDCVVLFDEITGAATAGFKVRARYRIVPKTPR